MPQFTYQERTWIVERISSGLTYHLVQQEFLTRFKKNAPAIKNMKSIIRKFREHGTVTNLNAGNSGRRRVIRTEENINQVRAHLQADNSCSIRKTARMLGIAKTSVHRIAKELNNSHAYDDLTDHSKSRRMEFVIYARARILSLLDNVWFSGETYVSLTGHNTIGIQNKTLELKQNQVIVWGAINANHGIIFSIMPQVNVNTTVYVQTLQNVFIPELQRLDIMHNAIFMQDEAGAHTSKVSMNFLHKHFGDRIISHRYLPINVI